MLLYHAEHKTHDDVLVGADDVRKSVVEVVLLRPPFRVQSARHGSVMAHRCAVPDVAPKESNQTNAYDKVRYDNHVGFVLGL